MIVVAITIMIVSFFFVVDIISSLILADIVLILFTLTVTSSLYHREVYPIWQYTQYVILARI
jgi:hypothetical protein